MRLTGTGATTKELRRRLGHSFPAARLYQHAAGHRDARHRPRARPDARAITEAPDDKERSPWSERRLVT